MVRKKKKKKKKSLIELLEEEEKKKPRERTEYEYVRTYTYDVPFLDLYKVMKINTNKNDKFIKGFTVVFEDL